MACKITLLLALFFCTFVFGKEVNVDVLILGGGVSGIVAANQLYNDNITNFLILEAQEYVGGRVKNLSFAGRVFSEGANWIHEIEEGEYNPILELAKKLDLHWVPDNASDITIKNVADGKKVYVEKFQELNKIIGEILEDNEKSPLCKDRSLRDSFEKKGWVAKTNPEKIVEWFLTTFEYGDTPEFISTTQYGGYPFRNSFIIPPPSFSTVIDYLMKNITDKIRLNSVITEVDYSAEDKVKVKISNGDVYIAKYTLCTFSSNVVVSDLVKFIPELPSWKINALKKIPLAYYTHVMVRFPQAFWDDTEQLVDGGETAGNFSVIVNMNNKHHYPGSNMLLFTAIEKLSKIVENQADKETIKEVMKTLKNMYPDITIPQPSEHFISKWSRNRFVQGSYSNAVVGITSADFKNIAGKIHKLFFAGEATSEEYWGYLQGAYFTGEEQGKAISRCYHGKKCDAFKPKDTKVTCTSTATTAHVIAHLVATVAMAATLW